MAFALIVLAIGSVLAGYIGVPHALGGHNALGTWLEPAFQATNCGAPVDHRRAGRAGGARTACPAKKPRPASTSTPASS